jgi:hypothetical protein
MAAQIAEHFDHQIGGAVDHFGDVSEDGSAFTKPPSFTTGAPRQIAVTGRFESERSG